MITKIKPVYYCEFCNKSGRGKWQMERHEKHCTVNPDRACRMCEYSTAEPIDVREILTTHPPPKVYLDEEFGCFTNESQVEAREWFDKVTENVECPACKLALIRCAGFPYRIVEFNFKAEKDAIFAAYNEANDEDPRELDY